MQIKDTIYTPVHLLEMLKLKRLPILELAKMRGNWKSHTLLVKTTKTGTGILENSYLTVSHKVSHIILICIGSNRLFSYIQLYDPGVPLLRYLPNRKEHISM